MKRAVRNALRQVENVLLGDNDDASHQLWDILTALRGPDLINSSDFKRTTAAIVRSRAFPRIWKTAQSAGAGSRWHKGKMFSSPKVVITFDVLSESQLLKFCYEHYHRHITDALEALGLEK